jgi:hypothetical protein
VNRALFFGGVSSSNNRGIAGGATTIGVFSREELTIRLHRLFKGLPLGRLSDRPNEGGASAGDGSVW